MVARIYNGFKLWVIPNVLSRQQKTEKKKFPIGNENRERDKLAQCDPSKYVFRYIYGFNLLRTSFFSLFSLAPMKMRHTCYSNSIVFDSMGGSVSSRHEPKQ